MMDYDCRSSEKRLAAVENDWLAAPENAELLEVYTCSLCGNPIFEGDEYLAVDWDEVYDNLANLDDLSRFASLICVWLASQR